MELQQKRFFVEFNYDGQITSDMALDCNLLDKHNVSVFLVCVCSHNIDLWNVQFFKKINYALSDML